MFSTTGCDGIMIARAAQGNPWIFRQILEELETGVEAKSPDYDEICRMILRHAALQEQYKGEYTAVREMRKHVAWYTTGIPGSAAFRKKVNEMETMSDFMDTVKELFANL